MIRTRFAPSPNGPLHLGHAYAAIVAHDLARGRPGSGGGAFLVRIEDIDGTRSRPELADEFLEDLAWLGLGFDGEAVRQSRRLARHAEAAERLRAMGLLYPCTCTRAQIAAASRTAGPDGPVYPGTCRHRARDAADAGLAQGEAAWRLDVGAAMAMTGALTWSDETFGEQRARPDLLGDVVLVRKELPASYHLAVTLDDAASGVTLVTRGTDLLPATHVHRLLQALLGLPVPVWHHHPLLLDAAGRKLAKRRGSGAGELGLAARRRAGEDGRALAEALRAGRLPAGVSLSKGLDRGT